MELITGRKAIDATYPGYGSPSHMVLQYAD
ncbi:hypothetical protein Patl1_15620 [Pistacia atlantica]|uniref:Uncharacterized protein n=1 Tax=Pistacia atlantica TaxID=434234 RepID=A0ACC1BAV8_9ROSI|nr:hypothetical protein Patl1_15620 [Pistacia atlantica]